MDKTQIAHIASQMSTREDLLALLNCIKKDKMQELGFDADKFYPFTMKHILYYCNPNHVVHRYRQFKIKKKSGGFRQITTPRNQSFMKLLQSVNEMLKAMYTPSDYAMGFTEGRSVITNAMVHTGQNYVFNIDLKDFFPSIEQPRIWKRLQLAPFNFSQTIANVLAGLCSMRETRKSADGKEKYVYVLPQGAPTSPIITNMICDTLDRRLAGLAKRFGLHYTRYADDITFSSMHNVYAENGEFRKELIRIIEDQGFTINKAKTRLQKRGSRQEVTGIIVNKKLNVTKKYTREIRSLLHIWEKYGYSTATFRYLQKYASEKEHTPKGMPNLIKILNGKLMYLKMVKSNSDPVYLRLNNKFQELIAKDAVIERQNAVGITYTETIPLPNFEQNNQTHITFLHKKDNKRFATFQLKGIKQFASINKQVSLADELQKGNLAISNCCNGKGQQFWLIHLMHKIKTPQSQLIDIDELNNDLDSLLNTLYG